MEKKRILLVGPRVKQVSTGVAMAFDVLVSGLIESGHSVWIVNTHWGVAVRNPGRLSFVRLVVVATCVARAWCRMPWCQILYMPIATSTFGYFRDWLIINAASLFGMRVVLHLHGGGLAMFYSDSAPWLQQSMRRTFAKADQLIVLGELLRDQFSFIADASQKVAIVYNATPIDASLIPNNYVKTPPAEGQSWKFLYLSNLMVSKGYLDLVDACQLLIGQGIENFVCDICGTFLSSVVDGASESVDRLREEFLQSIARPEFAGRIRYHGTVRGELKNKLLRDCHVLVLPTYYPWEGQPISINEAMAWATPVISTKHRGIPEQVVEGVNGVFVSARSPHSIAGRLKAFIEMRVNYEMLSKNARARFETYFTTERHLASLIPIIIGR